MTAKVEADAEDEDLMDEEVGDLYPRASVAPLPKIKSAITGGSSPRKTKGRRFREEADADREAKLSSPDFDSIHAEGGPGALRSIEGWMILVTGLHEESQEDDLQNAFGEFQEIKNLHLNLGCRTGFVKVIAALSGADMESSNLIVGIDFIKSDEWTVEAASTHDQDVCTKGLLFHM